MCRAIPLLPSCAVISQYRVTFTFTFTFYWVQISIVFSRLLFAVDASIFLLRISTLLHEMCWARIVFFLFVRLCQFLLTFLPPAIYFHSSDLSTVLLINMKETTKEHNLYNIYGTLWAMGMVYFCDKYVTFHSPRLVVINRAITCVSIDLSKHGPRCRNTHKVARR